MMLIVESQKSRVRIAMIANAIEIEAAMPTIAARRSEFSSSRST